MGAETIVIRHHTPGGIHRLLALILRTDGIPPMILIGITTARPAQHRDLYFFQRFHDIHPDLAVLPEAVIDTASQVLRKMTVDKAADDRPRTIPHGHRHRLLRK